LKNSLLARVNSKSVSIDIGKTRCGAITGYIRRALQTVKVEKSTKEFIRTARRTPGFGFIDTLHGYLYARWPYFWISIGTGRHRLVRLMNSAVNLVINALMHFPADGPRVDARGLHLCKGRNRFPTRGASFSDTYHGKVIRLESAKQMVSLGRSVNLKNLEKVIPYSLARDIILDNSDRILALDCPCRAVRSNPCLPLDVCLVFGEPFVSFVAEHHAHRSRFIDREEAIDILVSEAKRGHVHHAFFKEAAFGRFFAICNCCDCCCGAMQAWRNGVPMLASSGYVSTVDATVCIACGTCEEFCQFNAIAVVGQLAKVDQKACMGCGVCEFCCPQNAVVLQRDNNQPDPLELAKLCSPVYRH
jgi:Pyruvate/2-oxoacid:ferredoxin oxidoreductase delta subunit